MTLAIVDHDSDEYRQFQESRLDGLGGSDIAAILGLSKWGSPYSVWLEKTTREIPEPSEGDQEQYDRGHDAEAFLARQFQRHHPSLVVRSEQTRLQHPAFEWAFAHVDGLAMDNTGGHHDDDHPLPVGIWEAKTSNDFAPWESVPAYYLTQLQWAMWLADLPVAFCTVGFAGWKTQTYVVQRDEDDIALIVSEAQRFWIDNVLAGVVPDIDGHSATGEALARRYPNSDDDEAAELDPADLAAWRTLKADEKAVKAELTAVQNRMASTLGDAAVGLVDGEKAVTYKSQTRTTTCGECGHSNTSNPFRVWRGTTTKGN